MAYVTTKIMRFGITLAQDHHEHGEGWVNTFVTFQFHHPETWTVVLEHPVPLRVVDIYDLLHGIRHFVDRLATIPDDMTLSSSVEPFEFVPLELQFAFDCLDGEVTRTGEGDVHVRVMMNVAELTDTMLASEYIGCETRVTVAHLLEFSQELENELHTGFGYP